MGIISEFTAFLLGRGETKTVKAQAPTKTVSLIFLDYRNLQPQWEMERYTGIRWELIRKEVNKISAGSVVLHQSIYRSPQGDDPAKDIDVQEAWSRHGYKFETHTKDVDSWIASDLWQKTLEAVEDPSVKNIKIILGSADVDFVRPLERIKARFSATHTVTISIVAWRSKMGPELPRVADALYFLETVPNLLRHAVRREKR